VFFHSANAEQTTDLWLVLDSITIIGVTFAAA